MRRDTGRFLGFGVYANESSTAWAESLKVYINDDGDEVTVEPELAKPFDMMLEPIKTDISVINKSKMLGIDKFSKPSKTQSATPKNSLKVADCLTLFKLTRTTQIFLSQKVLVRTFWWR